MSGATYDDLESVLDNYEASEIRVMSGADGFRIYEDEGDSYIGDELLWRWDPSFDRMPYKAMTTMFERLGHDVEVM